MRHRRAKRISVTRTPLAIIAVVVAIIVAVNVYYLQGPMSGSALINKESSFQHAPELAGIAGYINTGDDITLEKLRNENKVVLVDFWTYSCINCQRTTPYLNAWYEKYSGDGFVIVGVHSPEFSFEKDYENVLDAVEDFGIKYPVVQDNDFETWRAYKNNFWPRKYLIDVDGFIRYDHIGEGAYDETEGKIQELLAERAEKLRLDVQMDKDMSQPEGAVDVDYARIGTPEIYLGYEFARARLGNSENFKPEQVFDYKIPDSSTWGGNTVYLDGPWYSAPEYIELRGDSGTVGLIYSARDVNIVAGGKGDISVFVDGLPTGTASVDGQKLYNLVSLSAYGVHELRFIVTGDVQVYTFTFG